MNVDQIRRLEPKLAQSLDHFHDCFGRKDTHAPRGVSVRGQLSDRPEKSVEPSVRDADVAPRTLQEFLSQHRWDEGRLGDRLPRLVAAAHQGPHTVGLVDETGDPKKGDKTPGVPKPGCGRLGQTENCLVTVPGGWARGDFPCLRDGALDRAEGGDADRDRCHAAGHPDDLVYRPQGKIARELSDRAVGHGVRVDGLTCDAGDGGQPERLRELATRPPRYVAEVPRRRAGWLERPRIVTRPDPTNRRGRGPKVPRLASGSRPARRIDAWLNDPRLRDQPWPRFRVKDGAKGPRVGEGKRVLFTVKGADGWPGEILPLRVARVVLDPDKVKFFVSNAPPGTGVETLLWVAFSRWRVARCFADQKSAIGLDQSEGRRHLGLRRPLIISAVSDLFLAWVRQEGGEKPGADGLPAAHGDGGEGPLLGVAVIPGEGEAAGEGGEEDPVGVAAQRPGPEEPHEDDSEEATRTRHQAHRAETVPLGYNLAL